MKENMNIYEKLSNIQNELKAPKNQKNTFGNYRYRSCEDILEGVKPICKKYETALILSDELVVLGEHSPVLYTEQVFDSKTRELKDETRVTGEQRYYIKATARLVDYDGISSIENTAYAREEEVKKGMDGSQITGTASSYARKYALNGLFNIDDTKDADTDEYTKRTQSNDDEKENLKLITELDELIFDNNIDRSKVYEAYKVESNAELTLEQLKSAIKQIKDKVEKKK